MGFSAKAIRYLCVNYTLMSQLLDQQVIAEIKGLIMDGTRKANSGHPGGAFSSADFAVILFQEFLQYAPQYTKWHNRDRFVLSAGHESMLLYSLLHFMGLIDKSELENFRQMGSLTPGHPENHLTPGVEATTGPLGQGVAMAVGMAVASKHQTSVLGEDLILNKIYTLCGDGDLQEDVAIGAATLAGHLGLDNLVLYYDKNDIQISGKTSRCDSTQWPELFAAIGWEVIEIDGHDHQQIRAALTHAQNLTGKPLIIIGNTVMANGASSMQGSHKAHGEPFKPEEIEATKAKLGLDPSAFFQVSEAAKNHFNKNLAIHNQNAKIWEEAKTEILADNPLFKELWDSYFSPEKNPAILPYTDTKPVATRAVFGKVLEHLADIYPGIIGGSADLEPSNNTAGFAAQVGEFNRDNYAGKNLAFGVREFPMAAMLNGMALYSGMIPFGATFLTFSDYSRNALRMSAIQKLNVLHVFTHDSIFLGEDGPTHQAVEHVMSLRTIPDFMVIRPADAHETIACLTHWTTMHHAAATVCLTRQALPVLGNGFSSAYEHANKGAYVKFETKPNLKTKAVIYATGSEVHVAIEAATALASTINENIKVVSMPCWEWFDQQNDAYKAEIMCTDAQFRVSIEAGVTLGWQRFTGLNGLNIGVDTFGYSAPAEELAEKFGLTISAVTERIRLYLQA